MIANLLFVLLHVAAILLTGCIGLIITIPLHLIYLAVRRPRRSCFRRSV